MRGGEDKYPPTRMRRADNNKSAHYIQKVRTRISQYPGFPDYRPRLMKQGTGIGVFAVLRLRIFYWPGNEA